MTVHGSNMPKYLGSEGNKPNEAARREGHSIAAAEFNFRMQRMADEGVPHAQEYAEREANKPPSEGDIEFMREHPDAFSAEYLERWKHLL